MDAFGLPAEKYLNRTIFTQENGQKKYFNHEKQLKFLDYQSIGEEISTCEKEYYKHQQALFIDFYNQGLVSRKETMLTDPVENTVLANEQVINGRGWRSNAIVAKNFLAMVF